MLHVKQSNLCSFKNDNLNSFKLIKKETNLYLQTEDRTIFLLTVDDHEGMYFQHLITI